MKRIVIALAASGLAFAGPALAQTTWDMATPYPEAEFHTKNIREFVEDISEETGGELEITVHSGQSLFKHPEIKRSVQTGLVPMGEILMSNLLNENPIFGADAIPFLATSYEDAEALWQAQRPIVEELLAEDGIRILYAVPWPGQGYYTAAPVESVADMEGMKFRTYNAATARMAELLGATPTIVEAVEIPQAFSTGIVDAMVTSAATGVRTKAWDFSDHFYDLRAWMPKNIVIVNERAFGRLPEAQRQAILEAAAEAEERGWQMSREVTETTTDELAANMEVHEPSPEFLAEVQAIGAQMAEEWAESAGENGETVLEALGKQ